MSVRSVHAKVLGTCLYPCDSVVQRVVLSRGLETITHGLRTPADRISAPADRISAPADRTSCTLVEHI